MYIFFPVVSIYIYIYMHMYNFKVDWFRCLELHLSQIKNENWLFKIKLNFYDFNFFFRLRLNTAEGSVYSLILAWKWSKTECVCQSECTPVERALTHRSQGDLLESSQHSHLIFLPVNIFLLLPSSSQERPPSVQLCRQEQRSHT